MRNWINLKDMLNKIYLKKIVSFFFYKTKSKEQEFILRKTIFLTLKNPLKLTNYRRVKVQS